MWLFVVARSSGNDSECTQSTDDDSQRTRERDEDSQATIEGAVYFDEAEAKAKEVAAAKEYYVRAKAAEEDAAREAKVEAEAAAAKDAEAEAAVAKDAEAEAKEAEEDAGREAAAQDYLSELNCEAVGDAARDAEEDADRDAAAETDLAAGREAAAEAKEDTAKKVCVEAKEATGAADKAAAEAAFFLAGRAAVADDAKKAVHKAREEAARTPTKENAGTPTKDGADAAEIVCVYKKTIKTGCSKSQTMGAALLECSRDGCEAVTHRGCSLTFKEKKLHVPAKSKILSTFFYHQPDTAPLCKTHMLEAYPCFICVSCKTGTKKNGQDVYLQYRCPDCDKPIHYNQKCSVLDSGLYRCLKCHSKKAAKTPPKRVRNGTKKNS